MPSMVVLIILAVAIIAPTIGWWQSALRLDLCEAKYQSFEDKTRLAGERSQKEKDARETELATAAVTIQGELNETRIARDKRYAEFERLLASAQAAGASGGGTSGAAPTAARLSCPNGGAEFNSALAGFEVAVSREILKSRDEAIERNIACKAYIERITEIMTNKPESKDDTTKR